LRNGLITYNNNSNGLVGKRVGLFTHGYAVQKVRSSNPGHGSIVGGVFHLTRQLARFSLLNMPYIVNCKFI